MLTFVKHKDLQQILGGNSFEKGEYRGKGSTYATIGVCKRKFPHKGILHVIANTHGDIYCSYPSEMDVSVGDSVLVVIAMGMPFAIKKVSYGFSDGKSLYIDIYADKDRVGVVDESHDYPSEVERLSFNNVSYISDVPHKVFAMGMCGLDVRYDKAVLFSHGGTKIEVTKNKASIVAKNTANVTPGGVDIIMFNDGEPFRTRTIQQKDNSDSGGMKNLWNELTGDIVSALKGMGIDEITIPSKDFTANNAVKVEFLVGEGDIEEYKRNISVVSHMYTHRKLRVSSETEDGTLALNQALLYSQGLSEEDFEYTCGVATFGSKKIPILYLKAIMKDGSIIEFTSGKRITIADDEVRIRINTHDINLGSKKTSLQRGETLIEYPVSERSTIFRDTYSQQVELNKGTRAIVNYKSITEKRINYSLGYEVDVESGIETIERNLVPNRISVLASDITSIEPDSRLGSLKPYYIVSGKDSNGSFSLFMDLVNTSFSYSGKGEKGESKLYVSPSYGTIEAQDSFVIKTENLVLDTELTISKGRLFLEKGIYSKGEFQIDSENIILVANKSLYLAGENIYQISEKETTMRYGSSMGISSSKFTFKENGERAVPSTILMSDIEVRIQGERFIGYGNTSVAVVAKDNASFGAENTVIYGVSQ